MMPLHLYKTFVNEFVIKDDSILNALRYLYMVDC